MATLIYVATDLTHIDTVNARRKNDWGDYPCLNTGKTYRALSPAYYAWLRKRMDVAKRALQSKKLSPPAWQALRERFNGIHDIAVALFGEQALVETVELVQAHPAWMAVYPAPEPPYCPELPDISDPFTVDENGASIMEQPCLM